jgi:hypothetical protein
MLFRAGNEVSGCLEIKDGFRIFNLQSINDQ